MKTFQKIRVFQWVLVLIALHSMLVGLGLIFLPFSVLSRFGFTVDPYRFFSTQGGVFHIVLSVAYLLAARNPAGERSLLIFIIATKLIAFGFLTTYFLLGEQMVGVALSAVGDGLMGVIVLGFYRELFQREAGHDG